MDRSVTRKTNVQNYKTNLETIKVMSMAREKRNSRTTATIVEKLTIKRQIVGKTPRKDTR